MSLVFIGVPLYMAIANSSAGAVTRLLWSAGAYVLNIAVQFGKAYPSDARTKALAYLEVVGVVLLTAGGSWMLIHYTGLAGALIAGVSGFLIVCGTIKQISRR